MEKYYDDPKYNAAFDRCIDVMTSMILKYGPAVLERQERERKEKLEKQESGVPEN